PQINFTAGQPVARHVIAPPPQFQSATPTARVPGIIPGRESVLGAISLGRIARPPPAVMDRPVVTHRQPPPAIQAHGGHPAPTAPSAPSAPTPAAAAAAAAAAAHRGIPERS